MNLYRFYLPELRGQHAQGTLSLPADQAHHARAVLRLEAGSSVIVFDGAGAWTTATVGQVTKSSVSLTPTGSLVIDPPAAIHLTIATAVPKGDRADWLIEQASQLNVSAIQWLNCDRGVVKPRENGGKMEKWNRLAIESAKQCHRAHILRVYDMAALWVVLGAVPGGTTVVWLNPNPGAGSISGVLGGLVSGKVLALIGPEGGWSDAEAELLQSASNVQQVRLTPTILRIETAAAAVAALVTCR